MKILFKNKEDIENKLYLLIKKKNNQIYTDDPFIQKISSDYYHFQDNFLKLINNQILISETSGNQQLLKNMIQI